MVMWALPDPVVLPATSGTTAEGGGLKDAARGLVDHPGPKALVHGPTAVGAPAINGLRPDVERVARIHRVAASAA